MQTQEEIQKEIKILKSLRGKVPQATLFGDDNRAAIDAQIWVLVDGIDSYDDIYEEFPKGDIHRRDAAMEAMGWLNGECDESPSEGWIELVGDYGDED